MRRDMQRDRVPREHGLDVRALRRKARETQGRDALERPILGIVHGVTKSQTEQLSLSRLKADSKSKSCKSIRTAIKLIFLKYF